MSVFAYHLLGSEQKSKATFVYAECPLLSSPYFAPYLCVLSCSETLVETKHKCDPQGDQRFNLTRWDKLEKDFDFPLCFATRKADFFFFPSRPFFVSKGRDQAIPRGMSRCGHLQACLVIL